MKEQQGRLRYGSDRKRLQGGYLKYGRKILWRYHINFQNDRIFSSKII